MNRHVRELGQVQIIERTQQRNEFFLTDGGELNGMNGLLREHLQRAPKVRKSQCPG